MGGAGITYLPAVASCLVTDRAALDYFGALFSSLILLHIFRLLQSSVLDVAARVSERGGLRQRRLRRHQRQRQQRGRRRAEHQGQDGQAGWHHEVRSKGCVTPNRCGVLSLPTVSSNVDSSWRLDLSPSFYRCFLHRLNSPPSSVAADAAVGGGGGGVVVIPLFVHFPPQLKSFAFLHLQSRPQMLFS